MPADPTEPLANARRCNDTPRSLPRREPVRQPARCWSRIGHGALALLATLTAGLVGACVMPLSLIWIRLVKWGWNGPVHPWWLCQVFFWVLVGVGALLGSTLALRELELLSWRRTRHLLTGSVLVLGGTMAVALWLALP
jgi:hypothetical protein